MTAALPGQLTWEEAALIYETSADVERDALDWVATTHELPADVVDAVVEAYRRSSLYDTKVDDIQEGIR